MEVLVKPDEKEDKLAEPVAAVTASSSTPHSPLILDRSAHLGHEVHALNNAQQSINIVPPQSPAPVEEKKPSRGFAHHLSSFIPRWGASSVAVTNTNEKSKSLSQDTLRIPQLPIRKDTHIAKNSAGQGRLKVFLDWIGKQGYAIENHTALTEDGYILNIQRLTKGWKEAAGGPSVPKKGVVLMQHGLLDSAATWVVTGDHSLGFTLANSGYDVWLSNVRGVRYCKGHTTLTKSSDKFWEFSWDQFAKFDLPAVVAHVLAVSQSPSLTYIGHSQGTTMFFAAMSLNPTLQQRIDAFIAFCPVVWVVNQYSTLLNFLHKMKTEAIFSSLGMQQFLQPNFFMTIFPGASKLAPDTMNLTLLKVMMSSISGWSEDNFDPRVVPHFLQFMPGGTSVRNMVHWSQLVNTGLFRAFDHGKETLNVAAYGSKDPPTYDPSRVQIPVHMYIGGNDKLVHPDDLHRLILLLPNVSQVIEEEKYGHLDFLWGRDAKQKHYTSVLNILEHSRERKSLSTVPHSVPRPTTDEENNTSTEVALPEKEKTAVVPVREKEVSVKESSSSAMSTSAGEGEFVILAPATPTVPTFGHSRNNSTTTITNSSTNPSPPGSPSQDAAKKNNKQRKKSLRKEEEEQRKQNAEQQKQIAAAASLSTPLAVPKDERKTKVESDQTRKATEAVMKEIEDLEAKGSRKPNISATNLLVQEIKRLRAENNSLAAQMHSYDRATKHLLNKMLERNEKDWYDCAFEEFRRADPLLSEASIRAIIIRDEAAALFPSSEDICAPLLYPMAASSSGDRNSRGSSAQNPPKLSVLAPSSSSSSASVEKRAPMMRSQTTAAIPHPTQQQPSATASAPSVPATPVSSSSAGDLVTTSISSAASPHAQRQRLMSMPQPSKGPTGNT